MFLEQTEAIELQNDPRIVAVLEKPLNEASKRMDENPSKLPCNKYMHAGSGMFDSFSLSPLNSGNSRIFQAGAGALGLGWQLLEYGRNYC